MKLRCFVIAIMVFMQSMVLTVNGQETVAYSQNAAVVGSFDFGTGSKQPLSITNGSVENMGGEYGNVLKLATPSGAAASYLIFDKKVNSGKLAVSYDIYSAQKDKEAYVRMLEGPYASTSAGEASGHFFEAYIMRSTGVFQMFNNTSWDVTGAPTIGYDEAKWNHVDMWFDFERRTASYYINGELLGTTAMAEAFDEIQGFVHSISNGGEQWIDNVYATEFTGGGNDMSKYPFIMAYPEEVEQKIMTEINIPEPGNAYFGKDVNLTVKVTEVLNEDFDGRLVVTLYEENGKSVVAEKELKLGKRESKEVEFSLKAQRYGFGEIKAECIRKDGANFGKTSTRMSVIAPAGKMNPKMGFADHISKNYGLSVGDEKLSMSAKAGAASIRDEIRWTEFEKTQGNFGPDWQLQAWFDGMEKTQQSKFAILGYYMPGRTQKGLPRTPADMEAFKSFITAVLEYTKDMKIDYELWNEQNMNVNADYGYVEDYVNLAKMVYPLVKEINPDAKLYVLATANVATVREYIEECFKLGIGDYCDGITIHPYNVALPPDDPESQADVYDIVALMEKYGLSDKELVFSEYGYTSSVNYGNEDRQANYTLQGAATYQDVADRIYWYNLQEKTTGTMSDAELHFGMIRGWANTEILCEPKPTFLVFSNYNRLMCGSEKIKQLEHSNENIAMHLFKNENGENTIIAWSRDENIRTALNVGADSVTVCDRYGNETVVQTRNGVLDVVLAPEPIYITGSNLMQTTEAKPQFNIIQPEITAVENDTAAVSGAVPAGNWEITADCPDNIKVTEISPIAADGTFKISFETGADGREDEIVAVSIKDKNTGSTVYKQELPVVYKTPVSVESSVKYYKNSHWQLSLKLVNNKKTGNLSGRVAVTEPDDLILSKSESVFENLIPGETRYVYVNIPIEKSMDELTMKGYVEIDGGERVEFSESSYFVGLMHLEKAPEIDGKISDNEYVTVAPVRADKEGMVKQITDWGGKSDISGTVYLNYDKDYFYLAARVVDNVEGATDEAARVWANDSIQFAFAEKSLITAGRTEIGIGKDNQGNPTIQRYSFLGTKFFAAGIDEAIAFDESCKLQIGREGNETIYELRMPWIDIYGDSSPKFTRRNALFSIIINDNDGTGRRGWMEFCPGIGGTKNAALFMKIPAM